MSCLTKIQMAICLLIAMLLGRIAISRGAFGRVSLSSVQPMIHGYRSEYFVIVSDEPLAPRGSRPLLLLGGVADALTEALGVAQEADGAAAASAAEACTRALALLQEDVSVLQQQGDLSALD